jgi:hypothetical protein
MAFVSPEIPGIPPNEFLGLQVAQDRNQRAEARGLDLRVGKRHTASTI